MSCKGRVISLDNWGNPLEISEVHIYTDKRLLVKKHINRPNILFYRAINKNLQTIFFHHQHINSSVFFGTPLET